MDMARVSACSYALRDQDWRTALTVIADAGFDKIDLLGRMPHLSLDPKEWDPGEVMDFMALRGLRLANLGTYVGRGFASGERPRQEQELQDTKRAIDLAKYFGARSIRVGIGGDDPRDIDRIVPWFQRAAEYADEKSVYMGFETHGGGISGHADLCADLCRRVGSRYFGVLYDPCNVYHYGEDYRVALGIYREYVTHVHLKDGRFVAGEFEYTTLGEGDIDTRWVMQQMDAAGYDGYWAVEYEIETESPSIGLKKWYRAAQAL
ncbi:MAG: sugar phosphate isomerase/epimerase family protein [Anaerolineae bacterium]